MAARAARTLLPAAFLAGALASTAAPAERVEVRLAGIDPRGENQAVLLLVDEGGRKMLPISVSPDQAESIYRGHTGTRTPRPLTHELLVNVLAALGVKLTRVDVTDLREGTYYAELTLDSAGRPLKVDSRPSDAIALALRVGAPIFAEPGLLTPFEGPSRPSVETHPLLGDLGLQLQDLTQELARFFQAQGTDGVLVAEAAAGGAAALSGVSRGDIIRRIAGEPVNAVGEALAALQAARERGGRGVEVQVVRDGRRRDIRLEW
jgi:bifunctional DNase/RNase